MGTPATRPKGEFVLLGVFALFIVTYLVDIRTLPMEGKILSYVLAFPLILLLLICSAQALWPRKKRGEGELPSVNEAEEDQEAENEAGERAKGEAPLGLGRTIFMGIVLFAAIFLFGFYLGSGLMLLLWFALFRRFSPAAWIVTVAAPLILYLVFEHLMAFGLYPGYVVELLQR